MLFRSEYRLLRSYHSMHSMKERDLSTVSKVIHVHLIFEKKNIYFGSISAIFETLTEKQVGITKSSLLHAGLVDDIAKYTKRAMIIQSRLITCTRKG